MSHQSMSFLKAESREKYVENEHQASGVSLSLNLGIQTRLEKDRENDFMVRKCVTLSVL